MMGRVAVLLTLVATVFAGSIQAKSVLQFDVQDAKNRPVTKVVTLLKDMLVQLEKESEEDQEIYDNMVCWCTTNDKEKVKSIDDAEARIEDLTTEIEELTAMAARLTTEIENLEKEIKKNEDALAKAKAMREKELAEFTKMETDTLQSIGQLGGAIETLSKHHPSAALLQNTQSQLYIAATVLQNEIQKNAKLLDGVLTRSQKRKIASFVQQPASAGSYAPASGEIFGILKQMKETFETDLAAAQDDEKKSQAAYEELKAAKEAEIAAAQEQVKTKTQELATTKEKKAQAEQDKADTMETLDADQKYLVNLKEKCSLTDKEFEERLATRKLEMQAVSKAMAVLTSDDAMDTFSSTFSFVQKASVTRMKSKRRDDASKMLADVARKYNNPHLMTLAMKVRLDAFEKVKQAIDDMIAELLKQKEDEIKQKDFCVDGFNENERQTTEKTREKTDLETLIEDLTMKIDELHKAIETLKAEIKELQIQMKRAGENRDKENKEFQQTVAEQRATQALLTKALDVLKGFYAPKLLQEKQEPAGPPPPPGFKEYKKSAASGGVMKMIQQIIDDAAAMEAEAIKGEEDALKAYEVFVTDTKASIDAKAKDIINKSEEKAKLEAERVEAEEQKAEAIAELENLADEKADLHKACDYVLKNFEIRQTARDEEVEALKQAKAILSGSKFSEFLSVGFKN
eukprot:gnl/MRDRNA2_/MRDRNA2_85554_c1_seq2.p1 gnl/MRDRNA2_/MRDRNA2_85554_c1~~gnl/MRDRNA2_/MRDRNA2_85554_c1_seq2.p1  ORF type:complete len:687 (-),score=269.87 gnl/MRDRNA2_/MRDRNA2_85554_c1_seq2:39-2099(-)